MWTSLDEAAKQEIKQAYELHEEETIQIVKAKMVTTKASEATLQLAQSYTDKSLDVLSRLSFPNDKAYLEEIVQLLAGRES